MTADASPPAAGHHGLRAHLTHLLPPLHALFSVNITINQLASVPLVNGEFAVSWKFKNTKTLKPKDQAKLDQREHEHDHDHDGDGDSFGSADTSAEDPHNSSNGHQSSSSALYAEHRQTSTARAERGQTPWLPLREHSVTWEQPLHHVVQMSVDRDTHRLLPHPFKLKVVQRVVAGDPDAPHNPRLGVVYIDLSEYADSVPLPLGSPPKGLVTRRFLLRDSKTNATLRLSIRVEPVNTNIAYTAPPLPNGEILAGVASLLTAHDDVFRTRPRALDLYAPVEIPSSSSKSSLKSKASSVDQTFDVRALPRAYGPRNTESLIEALFNPVSVREERLVGPFTKLVAADSPFPSSVSFTTSSSSSRPSTSTSSRSVTRTNTLSSNTSTNLVSNSRAPAHGHRHSPSLTPSIAPSITPSVSGASTSASTSTTHHWWQRNKDRPPSRNAGRTGTVAA